MKTEPSSLKSFDVILFSLDETLFDWVRFTEPWTHENTITVQFVLIIVEFDSIV